MSCQQRQRQRLFAVTNLTSVQYILLITDHRSLKSVQYMQCASVCLKVERRATRRDWSAARRATVII